MQKLTRNDKLSSNSWLLLDFKLLKPLSNSSSWRTYSCKTVSEIFVNCLKSLEEVGIEHCIKSVRIRCYFGPHFSRIFSHSDRIRRILCISPHSVRMQEDAGKMRTRVTPNTDTFYAVEDASLGPILVKNLLNPLANLFWSKESISFITILFRMLFLKVLVLPITSSIVSYVFFIFCLQLSSFLVR